MFEHSCYKYKEKYWKTDHNMCISQVKEKNEMRKLKQFYNSKKGTWEATREAWFNKEKIEQDIRNKTKILKDTIIITIEL